MQAQVLDQLEATKRRGKALILISHDLAVVSRLADTVAVMNGGEILEYGPASELLSIPKHRYTQALIDAIPSAESRGARLSPVPRRARLGVQPRSREHRAGPIIEAEGLIKRFRGPDGVHRTVVDDVSFALEQGETLGIVGESGSGRRPRRGSRLRSQSPTAARCGWLASAGAASPRSPVAGAVARSRSSTRIR